MLSLRLLIHISRVSSCVRILLSSIIILSRQLATRGLGGVLVLVVGGWLRLLVDVLLDIGFYPFCGGLVDVKVFGLTGGGGEKSGRLWNKGGGSAEGSGD